MILIKEFLPNICEGHLEIIVITFFFQWLVKKAIETREEMGDFIRAFSISQFSKTHKMPEVGL